MSVVTRWPRLAIKNSNTLFCRGSTYQSSLGKISFSHGAVSLDQFEANVPQEISTAYKTTEDDFRKPLENLTPSNPPKPMSEKALPNAEVMIVQTLPALPPKPAFPTVHLKAEDVSLYLEPLVSHNWRLKRAFVSNHLYHLSLAQRFDFQKYSCLMDFVNNLADISRTERHHPRIIIDKYTVEVLLHTHDAYRPRRSEENPLLHSPESGLTLRDVRHAMLVDKLFSEEYQSKGNGIRFVPRNQGMVQTLSLAEARKRLLQ